MLLNIIASNMDPGAMHNVGYLMNAEERYQNGPRARFPIIGWLVDNRENDRNPCTTGSTTEMRVGTLPSSLTLPPRTAREEPQTLSANEVCVLEQIRMRALARYSEERWGTQSYIHRVGRCILQRDRWNMRV